MKDTAIVNIFGGPGIGKSTTAAHLFALLKWRGVSCELVGEYAKERTWLEDFTTLDNQLYVFGKQHHRQQAVVGQVDVIITDGPLLNSLVYHSDRTSSTFKKLVVEQFNRTNYFNVLLKRHKPYYEEGRSQSEKEAREIDRRIELLLLEHGIPHLDWTAGPENMPALVDELINRLAINPPHLV